jgi:TonB family protein
MRTLLLIIFTASSSFCYSQKKQNVYYFKGNEILVKTKEEAEYIRVIQEPDSGSVLYNLLEFYSDNTRKTLGTVSKFEPTLVYEGQVVTFYKNGKKRDVANYKNGQQTGERYLYYKNGRLKQRDNLQKIEDLNHSKSPVTWQYKLWEYYDSTGVVLVKDGKGIFKTLDEAPKIYEEGPYSNGVKEGIWHGTFLKENASYEERYENGKLIWGKAKLKDGSITEYTSDEEMPKYKGGIENFYYYVGRSFRYPAESMQRGMKGRVIVSFVVQQDGSLTDVKAVKDLGHGTGEEAVRVVRSSPKWIPGRQHGVPVRVQYTLPLSLNLPPVDPFKN